MNHHRVAFDLETPVVYVDVGAREGIAPPFSYFADDKLKVVGFEPDPVEAENLKRRFPNREYYPFAVWSERARRKIYLNKDAATSSLFPPNTEYNSNYEDYHWKNRFVVREVEVQCESLDGMLKEAPDFIKLDTQGAEYEIIQGARRILQEGAPIVVAETWLRPVYIGQKTADKVIELMASMGYSVFDSEVAAAWRHRTSSKASTGCKQKLIGWELLFVKDAEKILEAKLSEDRFTKLCALLELYGFRDYALFLIEKSAFDSAYKSKLTSKFEINHTWEQKFDRDFMNNRLFRKIKKTLGFPPPVLYPKLHY
jgi:FkbM family methyltransferase